MGASKLRVKPALNLGMVIFSAGMTSFSPTSQYALGSTDAEHQRLIRQATWLAAHTERLFRESGIGPRQRVLDLGSGVGDVALIAARLVGPSGEVVGIERDPRSIALAAARMSEADLRNVSFTQSDAAQIPGDKPFDAAVGRYILMFLPDPISVLRSLSHLVRPGGILAFQEPCWKSFLQQSARLPLWSAGASLLVETFQRSGTNTEMGPALSRVFQEAGLPAPSTHTDTLMGSEQWLPDCLHSLRPKMAQLNLSLDPLGDFETLSERLQAEVKAFNTTAPLPDLVSAWSRKPASPASR
jgi:ubiquinone/menaquinone biosynthesis C-methylase UbiE